MKNHAEQPAPNFQDIIVRLNNFWADHGCLLWQPYSEKVGAGTMNPATVLRVLGPEPWNVGYAEPSYRPDDGRYGENPNRMQMHHQYQVILKPSPDDPQGTYLQSLEAIGIDTTKHDIRFVEDNWESPALGAWGLGWEVWLDGLEITQFTYFQQSASHVLDVPAVEITYGLERIAMFLQGARNVWDLRWNATLSYGDVLLQPEVDHCRYDFETASVDRLLAMYQTFEDEAKAAIAAGLTIPALDYVLRCSHAFNVLDARGAIGVNERVSYFGRMRDTTRQIAKIYLESREELGFPWTKHLPDPEPAKLPDPGPALEQAEDFVLEIGTEELPPHEARFLVRQLSEAVPKILDELRLSHEGVRLGVTPRRLVVFVARLAARQTEHVESAKGPGVDKAYDANGKPTGAAVGFARSKGVDVKDLKVQTFKGREVVVAEVRDPGRPAGVVLSEAVSRLVPELRAEKAMRWNQPDVAFSRPVRWLLALHGDQLVPVQFGQLVSDRVSRVPRHLNPNSVRVASAADYETLVGQHQVMVDRDQRRNRIRTDAQGLAEEVGGTIPADEQLLDEVTDLVEWPVLLRGEFDPDYLRLPRELLVTVMRKHQRYFPVVAADEDRLLPYFVTAVNGHGRDLDLVRRGNQDVLRARFADADYFVKQDSKQDLEEFVPRLAKLVFHERLGSMLDKQRRVAQLTARLADDLKLSASQRQAAGRAAELCKADLATSMVVEITSLQGFMGREYARRSGEPEPVADAIFEHYLPRNPGDAVPTSPAGMVLGLADRFDSLAGLFAAGVRVKSSADPFGLRRIAIGLTQLLVDCGVSLSLRQYLEEAANLLPEGFVGDGQSVEDACTFLADRLQVRLRDQGRPADVVAAVLAELSDDPCRAAVACTQLETEVAADDWLEVLHAYARCKRMLIKFPDVYTLIPENYTEPETTALHEQCDKAHAALKGKRDVASLVDVLRQLRQPINVFFDKVLVMAEDQKVRQARLALLQRIASLADGIADLSKLDGF